jgi:hypothetical protein
MNTCTAANHNAVRREPSYPRDELMVRGASPNASHTRKHYSQQDHLAKNRFRRFSRRPGER